MKLLYNECKKLLFMFFLLLSPTLLSAKTEEPSVLTMMKQAEQLYSKEQYSEALDLFIKAYIQAKEDNNPAAITFCTGYLGDILFDSKDWQSALDYWLEGYHIADQIGRESTKQVLLVNIVMLYCKMGNLEKAQTYHNLSKEYTAANEFPTHSYFVSYNEARLLTLEGKLEDAIKQHKKTLQLAREDSLGKRYELFQLSEIGMLQVETKHYEEAIETGQEALSLGQENKLKMVSSDVYHTLSESYQHLGKEEEARYYHYLSSTTTDSILNYQQLFKVQSKLKEYKNNKVESHITSLNQKVALAIGVLLLLSCILLWILYRHLHLAAAKKKLQSANQELTQNAQEIKAELEQLQVKKKKENTTLPLLDEKQTEELALRIQRVMEQVEVIANPEFNLQELARMMESNTTYVSAAINSYYSKNFNALLNEYRIREICRRLNDKEHYGQFTLQAIYESMGYTNATSFIRSFKREMNMSPSAYVKSFKKEQTD